MKKFGSRKIVLRYFAIAVVAIGVVGFAWWYRDVWLDTQVGCYMSSQDEVDMEKDVRTNYYINSLESVGLDGDKHYKDVIFSKPSSNIYKNRYARVQISSSTTPPTYAYFSFNGGWDEWEMIDKGSQFSSAWYFKNHIPNCMRI